MLTIVSEGKKRSAVLTVAIIVAIWAAFTIADVVKKDRLFSETENRILASRPQFTTASVLDGSYMKNYDKYVTDQFVGRDKWIHVKTRSDILLRKKEINGVYLSGENYLIEQHLPSDYSQEVIEKRLALLEKLVERWDADVMLVPTADNILADKLPSYTEVFDQRVFLESVQQRVGEEHYIDAYTPLWEHKDEYIYYRTDHHWTSRGAYYAYRSWAEKKGVIPRKFGVDSEQAVSENFLGTLHSKINVNVPTDIITYYPITEQKPVEVVYDLQKKANRLYEDSYLDTKNQYGYFLDDNHAFIEIKTDIPNHKTLFVIKDSYANCFIPLLSLHYETIYVVDLRYMNGKLFSFMESYEPERGMDVLVLYNCVHFLENFQYW